MRTSQARCSTTHALKDGWGESRAPAEVIAKILGDSRCRGVGGQFRTIGCGGSRLAEWVWTGVKEVRRVMRNDEYVGTGRRKGRGVDGWLGLGKGGRIQTALFHLLVWPSE